MADLYIPKSDLDGLKCESKVVSKYPLDYFSNIVKVIPAGTIVTIKLDNDYPMELLFKLAEGTADVLYLLAPRIESE
jgi:proliferating cell nuclear antigen